MFTGLVETVGKVLEVRQRSGLLRLAIASPWAAGELAVGDSVCVDGTCLTVTESGPRRFHADVIAETLSCTTLGDLSAGRSVNLERAIRDGDRLGGHWVQGHVDGVAPVVEVQRRGDDHRVRVGLTAAIGKYIACKGSVALQGVSLTISGLDASWFEVSLIPETRARTTLGKVRAGDRLNVEVDLLARYLERLLSRHGQRRPKSGET